MKAYICDEGSHHKNKDSLRKMMVANNIPYTECSDLSKVDESHDIVFCCTTFYPPHMFPSHCKVVYGPQFFVFPDNLTHPIHHYSYDPKRFFFNILTNWIVDIYKEMAPQLQIQYLACPLGIDFDTIVSVPSTKERKKVMVYYKGRHPSCLQAVLKLLEEKQESVVLIQYGSYKEQDFKDHLQDTKFVLWVGCHESQGFAFQETLASNIPILVWDVQSMYDEYNNGFTYESYKQKGFPLLATTTNCWSEECGMKIYNEEELEQAVHTMQETYTSFQPREYIQSKLSLQATFTNLMEKIDLNIFKPAGM